MSVVKTASGVTCGITILLFALIGTIENPETSLYEETVEMMMRQEGLTSDQEIEERFPVLIDIQSDMSRIDELNQIVLSKTRSPAPMITEEESLQTEYYRQRIHELRQEVRAELSQLIATYAEHRP